MGLPINNHHACKESEESVNIKQTKKHKKTELELCQPDSQDFDPLLFGNKSLYLVSEFYGYFRIIEQRYIGVSVSIQLQGFWSWSKSGLKL